MYADIEEILFSREVIEERVKELAAHVLSVYREHDLTMCVVLQGAFIFAADLVRHLPQHVDVLFVRSSSYGKGTKTNGAPALAIPDEYDWLDRHVLIVEDIVDSGHTMKQLMTDLRERGAASVRACAFLDKPVHRQVPVEVEFVGFTLEDDPFVVGFGLDYAGRFRNLPFVGTLKPHVYQED